MFSAKNASLRKLSSKSKCNKVASQTFKKSENVIPMYLQEYTTALYSLNENSMVNTEDGRL